MKENSILGFAILGFSAFLASLGLSAIQGLRLGETLIPLFDIPLANGIVLLIGVLLALTVLSRPQVQMKYSAQSCLCCILAVPVLMFGLLDNLLANAAAAYPIALFSFGVSIGILFTCWGGLWCKLYDCHPKKLVFKTLGGSVLAALCAIALSLLSNANPNFIVAVLAIISCLVGYLCTGALGDAPSAGSDPIAADEFWGRKKFRSFVYGAFFGLLISYAYTTLSDSVFAYLIAAGAGAAFSVGFSIVKKSVPEPDRLDRISSLVLISFALSLLLVPDPLPAYVIAVTFVATLAMTVNFLSHFSSSCTIVLQKHADPTKFLILLYLPVFGGMALILAASLFSLLIAGPQWEVSVAAALSILLAAISHVILPYSDEESLAIYKFINDLETSTKKRSFIPDETTLGRWRRACEAISYDSSLTKREAEILLLMAKGRNVSYISESLVISPHTAKTHIYHIYKKIGVSSHQDLIDLVEGTSAGLEDNPD